jgi:maltose alpha-D-glucosyltransferase/alpha-amylase
LISERIDTYRIRTHGNLVLTSWLFTGKDFVISNFNGDPRMPISERRLKRRPMRDLAILIHSLDCASRYISKEAVDGSGPSLDAIRDVDIPRAAAWGKAWRSAIKNEVIGQYRKTIDEWDVSRLRVGEKTTLLDLFYLNRSLVYLAEQLRNRTEWIAAAIESALEAAEAMADSSLTTT